MDEVVNVAPEQLEDLPAGGAERVRAIAKLEDRLVLLLDPAGLFAGELPGT